MIEHSPFTIVSWKGVLKSQFAEVYQIQGQTHWVINGPDNSQVGQMLG